MLKVSKHQKRSFIRDLYELVRSRRKTPNDHFASRNFPKFVFWMNGMPKEVYKQEGARFSMAASIVFTLVWLGVLSTLLVKTKSLGKLSSGIFLLDLILFAPLTLLFVNIAWGSWRVRDRVVELNDSGISVTSHQGKSEMAWSKIEKLTNRGAVLWANGGTKKISTQLITPFSSSPKRNFEAMKAIRKRVLQEYQNRRS